MKNTEKRWIRDLVDLCAAKGLQKAVISPGSRSAPLVIAFSRHPEVECLPVIDERSAGFFALGIAQQTQKPVALVCTSGSASLNFAPAIAEAYYQKVPLLILTADRPPEMVDQREGQTIRQFDIFHNYIKKSFQLPVHPNTEDDLWHSNRIVAEAINFTSYPDYGPVHVNVPLREPLYGLQDLHFPSPKPKTIEVNPVVPKLDEAAQKELLQDWGKFSNKLLLAGQLNYDQQLIDTIEAFTSDPSVTLLTETTSNLPISNAIPCIDPVLEAMPKDQEAAYQPELMLTFGGEVVSKKIKAFLRQFKPKEHWHLDVTGQHTDTFKSLTKVIPVSPVVFFKSLRDAKTVDSPYQKQWLDLYQQSKDHREQFLLDTPYCDLTAFKAILDTIPNDSNLHFANSTPIRYSNLFEIEAKRKIIINGNRGTSGIDGSISTAAGAAYVNQKLTTVITGDLGFFYDSNGLWNKNLPANLRVIILNNSGGNIFRIIPGPRDLEELEEFFETQQEMNAKHVAMTFGIPYYFCDDLKSLQNQLKTFFEPHDKAVILEVKTPNQTSADVLKRYMNM